MSNPDADPMMYSNPFIAGYLTAVKAAMEPTRQLVSVGEWDTIWSKFQDDARRQADQWVRYHMKPSEEQP